jgi:dihydroorotate dehydrogenase electron transfer subunit
MRVIQTTVEIVERTRHGSALELRLRAPDIVSTLSAGQPVLVRGAWGTGAYLRRAFYPVAIDTDSFWIRVGPSGDYAQAWLSAAVIGTQLDALGPVGVGFRLALGARNILAIGQDLIAWALLPIVLQAGARGASVTLATEAYSARNVIPPTRLPSFVEYQVATMDGSLGRQGVLEPSLPDLLGWADLVLAAGSASFYRQLARAIQASRFQVTRGFCQALLDVPLLCGMGACGACATDLAVGCRLVCVRGPVFDLADVVGNV